MRERSEDLTRAQGTRDIDSRLDAPVRSRPETGLPPGPNEAPTYTGMESGYKGAFSIRNLRTFTSFKNPVFRLYYGAMLGQMGAMNMQMLVRTLLVFRLTDSPGAVGLMAMANAAPMLFLAMFGGVIAERVEKKHVLLAGQAASGAIVAVVAVSLMTGALNANSWWILVAAAAAQGIVMGLMMPARQAIIAEIVTSDQLMNAVALNTFGMNSLRLMAPAVAGFLVDAFGTGEGISGFASVYFAMTALYVVAVAFILLMPRTGTITLSGQGALSDIVEGFRYVRHDPIIRTVLIMTLVVTLLSMSYLFMLPVFTETVFHVSASKLGLLISASGAGAMVGSIVLASLPNKKRGLMLILGSLVLGASLVGFSWSSHYYVAMALIVFVGVGQTARMTLGSTLLHYYVRNEYRARVMSMMMMEFGLTSFVVALTGVLAEFVGVQWAVGSFAMVLVAFSVWALLFMSRLRQLD